MSGQLYLMPTTNLAFGSTNGWVPESSLDEDQEYAYDYLKVNGFSAHSMYTWTDGSYYVPSYDMMKTGTVSYRAYYLDDDVVKFLAVHVTQHWRYSASKTEVGPDKYTLYNEMQWNDNDIGTLIMSGSNIHIPPQYMLVDYYYSYQEAYNAISQYIVEAYPITYRLTNATTTGPNNANVGDTVTVPLTFTEGYGVVNPSTDAYVTCNGVTVPSTYSNGQLTFTMPDPSQ